MRLVGRTHTPSKLQENLNLGELSRDLKGFSDGCPKCVAQPVADSSSCRSLIKVSNVQFESMLLIIRVPSGEFKNQDRLISKEKLKTWSVYQSNKQVSPTTAHLHSIPSPRHPTAAPFYLSWTISAHVLKSCGRRYARVTL